jgi:hypothetical protein
MNNTLHDLLDERLSNLFLPYCKVFTLYYTLYQHEKAKL